MGIVSLQSRKYDSFRFRMARFKLMSKVTSHHLVSSSDLSSLRPPGPS